MSTIRELLDTKGRDVFTIEPTADAVQAIREMTSRDIGALIVTDGGQVVGILSERDYVRKVVGKGISSDDVTVADIMSTRVLYIRPDQSVDEGLALMYDKGIRHLPVMESDTLVGVVSIKDLAGSSIGKRDFLIDQLANYISSGR